MKSSVKTVYVSNPIRKSFGKIKVSRSFKFSPYTPINFSEIDQKAKNLARIIEERFEDLKDILLEYESYEVVKDETARALDLLRNLEENKKYFRFRVGQITAFLPRNQPMYSFCCFVVVPSLMASEVHFCIPNAMRHFFTKMLTILDIAKNFPNITVSSRERFEFLRHRSALRVDPKSKETKHLNDVVIFTGSSSNADKLRLVFDKRTLFIANGSGHNPVVIDNGANIPKAVEAVLTLQFYNQGQDCEAPNTILVSREVMRDFLVLLRTRIKEFKVGSYRNESCRIGPISDPKDLARLQNFLIENRKWLDPSTPGTIRTSEAIIEPTIICKPLSQGGNFSEIFAPIIFVQEYNNDSDLKNYFEDPKYAPNAMYVTLYGESKYIKNLINRKVNGKTLHRQNTFVHNKHLHEPGMERGTRPYGGYGYGASSISINGKIIAKPTLPQRDIYEHVIKPLIRKKLIGAHKSSLSRFTKKQHRDIEKLLRLHSLRLRVHAQESEIIDNDNIYVDSKLFNKSSLRYIKLAVNNLHYLLRKSNIDYIHKLKEEDIKSIQLLKKLLTKKNRVSFEQFRTLLYAIPRKPSASKAENKLYQRRLFKHAYQLLFGKDYGPQLAPFLWDVDNRKINKLLENV